jgi:tetratricopeptide (TPR) repeat protein
MNPKRSIALAGAGVAILLLAGGAFAASEDVPVRLWEEPLVIPTYQVGAPDRNPLFYGDRAYQGARGRVYPYPMLDRLTDVREDKTYRAVYLENRYIKIIVLPELGGRIFAATDKTNGYDFFYHQHVIKPALIGMLGAWISGGVEWNIPHHHRATSFMPVDHVFVENPDGSKTVWVGEIEWRHRMKWMVGLTLYPDRSYIEATVRLMNRTPLVHSFLYFANVAVHANENYQVFFPPSTEYATFHGKTHFTRWPISTSVFNGVDYTRGVDLSWWKNHPSPTSFFAWNYEDDFFGGYDHGRKAGVVHVADHHIVPGKKLWEFANGDVGRMWDKILTENDGPYIELMAGAYSDNQPDYSWIQPYEVKTWKQYWYPIRELGGLTSANREAAVNLEIKSSVVRIGVNTSGEQLGARVLLQSGGRNLLDEETDIGPARPLTREVQLPQGLSEYDLRLSVLDRTGRELIAYSPTKQKGDPMPEAVKPPPPPGQIQTVEELYLTGLRLVQLYNPALEPYPYFEEALRRDPGNSQVNTALGTLYLQRRMFKEAEIKFRTAVARLTKDHTSPKDGEAFYYLAVALAAQEQREEAYSVFYKATWSAAWSAASYFALAQLDARKADYQAAIEHLDRSIAANGNNLKALDLKVTVLRQMGRNEEAARLASVVLAADPLDFWAGNELYLAKSRGHQPDEAHDPLQDLTARMRGDPQNYLELAVDYSNCGRWDEASEVLSRLDDASPEKSRTSPMVYYFLGYFNERRGNDPAAAKYYRLGSQADPAYCFPFRMEAREVLEHALKANPRDSHAYYYLGNLLYDDQPAEAIRAWEASRNLDDHFATVHRNLGLAYARHEKDLTKGIASLEKAVAIEPADARVLYELDMLSQQAGLAPEKRLARLESHQPAVLERDDAVQQQLALYVQLGQYDKALDVLARRHFHVWEGGGDIHNVYVDAHLLRGQETLKNKRYREALADFEAATEYPENLEVGRPLHPERNAEIDYWLASAHAALGDQGQARTFYEKAVNEKPDLPESSYFQAQAWRALGQEARAMEIFAAILTEGKKELEASADLGYFAKFGEKRTEASRVAHARYLMGLAYFGQGKRAEAKAEFQKVGEKDVNHLGATTQLAVLR